MATTRNRKIDSRRLHSSPRGRPFAPLSMCPHPNPGRAAVSSPLQDTYGSRVVLS